MEKELVFISENNKIVTDSRVVAEVFGKQHYHVLRDIKNLDCSTDFHKSNFGCSFITRELPNGGQKKDSYYTITKDGFTFLVMGYTGAKAAKFKEAYIAEFNRMEKELREGKVAKELPDIDTSKYGRKELAGMILESDAELGETLEKLEQKIGEVAVLKYQLEKKDEEIQRLRAIEQKTRMFEENHAKRLADLERKKRMKIAALVSKETPVQLAGERQLPLPNPVAVKPICDYRNVKEIRQSNPGIMLVRDMVRRLKNDTGGYGYVTSNMVFGWLRKEGYLLSDYSDFNAPSQEAVANGWIICANSGTSPNGLHYRTPYITPKGYRYFLKQIKEKGGLK